MSLTAHVNNGNVAIDDNHIFLPDSELAGQGTRLRPVDVPEGRARTATQPPEQSHRW